MNRNVDCAEEKLDDATFKGIFSEITMPMASDCWNFCRQQSSCMAVSYSRGSCKVYSYVSSEVRLAPGYQAFLKFCKDTCRTPLISDFELRYDVALIGDSVIINDPEVQNLGDCEKYCKYSRECRGISYFNPYNGQCWTFTQITGVRREANRRSARKWGCSTIKRKQLGDPCSKNFECDSLLMCTKSSVNPVCVCDPAKSRQQGQSCVPLGCGKPPTVSNSLTSGDSQNFGARVSYTCQAGYTLQGPTTVVCQSDGTWSTPPSCIGKFVSLLVCLFLMLVEIHFYFALALKLPLVVLRSQR